MWDSKEALKSRHADRLEVETAGDRAFGHSNDCRLICLWVKWALPWTVVCTHASPERLE
jgi:hypothetical protein